MSCSNYFKNVNRAILAGFNNIKKVDEKSTTSITNKNVLPDLAFLSQTAPDVSGSPPESRGETQNNTIAHYITNYGDSHARFSFERNKSKDTDGNTLAHILASPEGLRTTFDLEQVIKFGEKQEKLELIYAEFENILDNSSLSDIEGEKNRPIHLS